MSCHEIVLDDALDLGDDWLERIQPVLFERWLTKTRHKRKASRGTWACEIATGCRTCSEHLSVPCSLLTEANEIARLLESSCYTDEPTTFFRLYLIVLSEFVSQLHDLSVLMGLNVGKPPREVKIWANRWAKHRLEFMVLHHPAIVFSDRYGGDESRLRGELMSGPCVDRGREVPFRLVGAETLANKTQVNLVAANSGIRTVVVVPPLSSFLDATMTYFRRFVDTALANSEAVKIFESKLF